VRNHPAEVAGNRPAGVVGNHPAGVVGNHPAGPAAADTHPGGPAAAGAAGSRQEAPEAEAAGSHPVPEGVEVADIHQEAPEAEAAGSHQEAGNCRQEAVGVVGWSRFPFSETH
jgi:hypothetical protein